MQNRYVLKALGSLCLWLAGLALAGCHAGGGSGPWAQWGGPGRDFRTGPVALAAWGEEGPSEIWRRDLGEGYSAVVAAGGRLYTQYRRGEEEVVVALEAKTGRTLWEFAYEAPIWDGFNTGFGPGPNATPLVQGGRVYAVGVRALLHCLDAKTGRVVWKRDLWEEFGAEPPGRGFASSPLAYEGTLILPVGGKDGHGVMAFDLDDGAVVWKAQDSAATFSSPIVIDVDGQDQLVVFEGTRIVGLDPRGGALLWSHPHRTQYNINASTPVWGEGNLLFVSSAYDSGSRVVRLVRAGEATKVEELWFSKKMKVHHGTAVRLGSMVYGSSGDFGPAFLMGADIESGEMTAKQRGFAKANLLAAGDELILLDEKGVLALVRPGPEGFEVRAQAQVLTTRAWTVPTLVGATLYVRDRKEIAAFDLSP